MSLTTKISLPPPGLRATPLPNHAINVTDFTPYDAFFSFESTSSHVNLRWKPDVPKDVKLKVIENLETNTHTNIPTLT